MSYVILLASVLNLLLGIVVISRDRNRENVLFFIFALSASLWTFSNFYLRVSEHVFFLRLSYGLGVIVATLGLAWTISFLKERLSWIFTFYIVPVSVFFLVASTMTSEIISSLESIELFGYTGKTGPLFPWYSFHLGIVVFVIIYLLLRSLRFEKDPIKRSQRLFVLSGAVIFTSISLGVSFIVPTLFNTFNLTIFDNFGFSIFLIFIVYATVKHHLFNIRVVATELFIFALWLFILVRIFFSPNAQERLLNGGLLFATIIVGIFLIKSVIKEIESREEIERLANDLTVANERLKELDKLKSEFVSIASHQLRSPLTAIKGYASLIADGSFGKVPPGIQEAVDRILQASQSLVVMVEDFLNVSRIEQGKMKFEFQPVELGDMVEKVVDEQQFSAEKKSLKLTYSNDKQGPYCANADPGKIRQVVTNLIDNAIKYTPKGSVSVRLSRNKKSNKIVIAVADTGMGIDKDTLPTLFTKFTRAKDANKVNVIGTGLGLYIVREIVNGHSGRVWVESEGVGKGTTFFVELQEDVKAAHALKVTNFAKSM